VYLRYFEVKCEGFQGSLTGNKGCRRYRGHIYMEESMKEADRFVNGGAKR